ncbi:MAG: DUF4197 family protein, partial [Chitinophagales bacterium]
MKKLHYLLFLPFVATTIFVSCEDLNLDDVLSDDDVAAALKEALNVGTDTAVSQGSLLNGYFNSPDIKIFFPEEAGVVAAVVGALPGGDDLIDGFVESLNHAAEDAADEATPILKDAITEITFDDATEILN